MQQGGKRLNGSLKQPKVSIITVLYNAAKLLPAYLENVSAYLTEEVELVIVDGNSTDDTINVLTQNNALIDYWQSETDNGIYDAMNKAVRLAKGKWMFFLGADDHIEPGFINMVKHLADERTVYYGDTIYYGKPHTKVYDAYFLTKLNLVHQSIFYPRSVFDSYQYDLKYPVYADYYLNLQLWANKNYQFQHCDYLVAGFPEGGFSSHAKDLQFEQDRDTLFKEYLGRYAYYRYLNRTLGLGRALLRFITNG